MKAEKLRQLKPDELDGRVVELRSEFFDAKLKHATGQLDDSALLKRIRRNLAKALTVRAERDRAE